MPNIKYAKVKIEYLSFVYVHDDRHKKYFHLFLGCYLSCGIADLFSGITVVATEKPGHVINKKVNINHQQLWQSQNSFGIQENKAAFQNLFEMITYYLKPLAILGWQLFHNII